MKALHTLCLTTSPIEASPLGILHWSEVKDVHSEIDNLYLRNLKNSQNNRGLCSNIKRFGIHTGTVGSCLPAFLTRRDGPNHGSYAANIKKFTDYLLDRQQKKWNIKNARYLMLLRQPDGSINRSKGRASTTSARLLFLALNNRFLPFYKK